MLERFRRKIEVQRYLKDTLEGDYQDALDDYHAKRRPRPCGITIHPATGCPYRCVYCYVPDIGFTDFKPYPLTGLKLALALASNPYVAPGPSGSLAAFGSVTEPLLEPIRDRTLEYLDRITRFLDLSCQISTKEYVSRELALELKVIEPKLSVLVTIVTIDRYPQFEPLAPPPHLRFESIKNLSSEGLHTTLFLRPAIPAISDREAYRIISAALDHGARGVIVGSLRVTSGIIGRLRTVGVNIQVDHSRLRKNVQLPTGADTKNRIVKIARELDARIYPSACSANVDAHGEACMVCSYGPCGNLNRIPDLNEASIDEFLDAIGLNGRYLEVGDHSIVLSFHRDVEVSSWIKYFIEAIARRRVFIRRIG
ncbi:MAG: radical SAM protein [Candidatus Bathyarchaeota archaeon]|nr:radical SAM protein [Candidatus Bathyarchaeota archaeon]